jgi:hypothetical protein
MQTETITCNLPGYHAAVKTGRPCKATRPAFGERVAAPRRGAFTQLQVASGLRISQPSYALWERSNVALRPDQLTSLAQILGVAIEEPIEEPWKGGCRGGPARLGECLRQSRGCLIASRTRLSRLLRIWSLNIRATAAKPHEIRFDLAMVRCLATRLRS